MHMYYSKNARFRVWVNYLIVGSDYTKKKKNNGNHMSRAGSGLILFTDLFPIFD